MSGEVAEPKQDGPRKRHAVLIVKRPEPFPAQILIPQDDFEHVVIIPDRHVAAVEDNQGNESGGQQGPTSPHECDGARLGFGHFFNRGWIFQTILPTTWHPDGLVGLDAPGEAAKRALS